MKFQENRYPDKDARTDMAIHVGCGENSVYTWFNRRRSKEKDDAKDTIDPSIIMQGSRDSTPMEVDQQVDDTVMNNAPMLLPDVAENLQQSEETYYDSSSPSFTSPNELPQSDNQQQTTAQSHQNENANELSTLVGPTGGIPSPTSLKHLVQIMRNETRLVNRSVMLTLIMNTNDTNMLKSFVNSKGLAILRAWLVETAKSDNAALLVKLLETLKHLPIDLEALKTTGLGRVVKSMTKNSEKTEVKQLINELMQQWKQLIERVAETKTDEVKRTRDLIGNIIVFDNNRDQSDSGSDVDVDTLAVIGRLESLDRPVKKSMTTALPRETPKVKAINDTGFFDTLLAPSQAKNSMLSKSTVTQTSTTRNSKLGYSLKPPPALQPKTTPLLSIDSILDNWNASKVVTTPVDQLDKTTPASVNNTMTVSITTSENNIESKKRKRVTWALGEELTRIKFFESDPDEWSSEAYGMGTPHEFGNARDMDINEAKAAFHNDIWYPPIAICFPDDVKPPDVVISEESKTQMLREQIALAAVYFKEIHIPPSPAEPDEIPNDNLLNVRVIPLIDETELATPHTASLPTVVMPTSSGILSLSNTGNINDTPSNFGSMANINNAQSTPFPTPNMDLSSLLTGIPAQLAALAAGAITTGAEMAVNRSAIFNYTNPSVGALSNVVKSNSTIPQEVHRPLIQLNVLNDRIMQQLLKLTQSGASQQSNLPQQEYRTQSSQSYQVSSTPDYRAGNSYSDDYDEYDSRRPLVREGVRYPRTEIGFTITTSLAGGEELPTTQHAGILPQAGV
ncbi:LOW QUALITY PROTEIN: hypothetical protein BC937DRAFT_93762 [Endogone sp. FLAS-F59071]|nr:LOW QUALITY PROTEIN: hypothetical protein BC937DRAFT_93762 [Endogone sp. FLAS-F59071]|eukprot:RUS21056.1 LOW QUALITY PROTEIN: hypothetical protein BC937DRAFT_93762 [Endogone sp. FLAS-F59071]